MRKSFQESDGKQVVRQLLKQAASTIERGNLTYLGMPEAEALDIRALSPVISNVICIDRVQAKLDAARHSIANLPIRIDRYHTADMWEYLKEEYGHEGLVADVAFLDFLGGGITSAIPFQREIAALQAYFWRQAQPEYINRTFILAWTFMPHDFGVDRYLTPLSKLLFPKDITALKKYQGINFRSVAIRLLLKHLMEQHEMSATMYEHLLYKRVMNTIIVLFARGDTPDCSVPLGLPEKLVAAPVMEYKEDTAKPVARRLDVL